MKNIYFIFLFTIFSLSIVISIVNCNKKTDKQTNYQEMYHNDIKSQFKPAPFIFPISKITCPDENPGIHLINNIYTCLLDQNNIVNRIIAERYENYPRTLIICPPGYTQKYVSSNELICKKVIDKLYVSLNNNRLTTYFTKNDDPKKKYKLDCSNYKYPVAINDFFETIDKDGLGPTIYRAICIPNNFTNDYGQIDYVFIDAINKSLHIDEFNLGYDLEIQTISLEFNYGSFQSSETIYLKETEPHIFQIP